MMDLVQSKSADSLLATFSLTATCRLFSPAEGPPWWIGHPSLGREASPFHPAGSLSVRPFGGSSRPDMAGNDRQVNTAAILFSAGLLSARWGHLQFVCGFRERAGDGCTLLISSLNRPSKCFFMEKIRIILVHVAFSTLLCVIFE